MFKRLLRDSGVQRRYVDAGAVFGDAVSYPWRFMGFERLFRNWKRWEEEYSRRGYRTVALDDFIEYGGYGTPFPPVGVKREAGEAPVLHAEIYWRKYAHTGSEFSFDEFKRSSEEAYARGLRGADLIQTGTYALPSTRETE